MNQLLYYTINIPQKYINNKIWRGYRISLHSNVLYQVPQGSVLEATLLPTRHVMVLVWSGKNKKKLLSLIIFFWDFFLWAYVTIKDCIRKMMFRNNHYRGNAQMWHITNVANKITSLDRHITLASMLFYVKRPVTQVVDVRNFIG